jgi:hypothetical protein
MATTTTNYGFDVPTSSDLVKNGATQIALLGQDLDTFLFRPFNKNATINGAMDIWQRGTSFNSFGSTSVYTADRYYAYRGGLATGLTVSRQVTGDTTNLPNIQYAARLQRDSGNTSTAQVLFLSDWESVNSIPLAGKQVTFSFYARAGSNYSAASSAFSGTLVTGTGTDQALRSSYTGSTNAIAVTATLTTTWQRFQGTATLASTATQIGLNFNFTPVGTAGANDYVDVTGVQIEAGSQVTPFSRNGSSIQGELAACQRYYIRLGNSTGNSNQRFAVGPGANSTVASITAYLPVKLRVPVSSIDYSTLSLYDGSSAFAVTAAAINAASDLNPNVNFTVASGLTAKQFYEVTANNNVNGYIGFSAEL